MTIEQLKQYKRLLGYTNRQVSELSGVPLGTVQKIFSGDTKSPRYHTMKALEAVLCPHEDSSQAEEIIGRIRRQERITGSTDSKDSPRRVEIGNDRNEGRVLCVEEPWHYGSRSSLPDAAGAEKKQGEYTLDDYLALPEERRVELIDGVFYDMSAPFNTHQLIAGYLYRILFDYVRAHHGKCIPFIAPADVQLDRDNRTIVQPDVFVVCDRSKILRERTYGAPDMVIEVLSDSTRKKDMNLKLYKYARAGVGEYWIVDPKNKRIMVYLFENCEMVSTTIYGFQDKIPVHTLQGCVVDFSEIYEYIKFLLDD